MTDRFGTIFECDGKTVIRHRVREQDTKTVCGQRLIFDERSEKPTFHADHDPFHADHDLLKEERCKKCYPNQRKAKSWRTGSKKK